LSITHLHCIPSFIMPTYSSEQFYKDWRYSVEKDFTNPSGKPVKYAHGGLRTWGSEHYRIPFTKRPARASVNCDGSLIAIAVEDDIYIHDTVDFSQVIICKGHVSNIDAVAFQPGNPKVLASSAQNDYAGSPPADPTIILWDLDEQQVYPMMEPSTILSIANQATETVVKSLLHAQPRLELSTAEEKSLTSAIEPVISRIVRTHSVANQRSLYGRLQKSFQSEVFGPSGAYLIYLPGRRPRSNGSDVWDVQIYSMSTHKDIFTLTGHTDALMWTGYSPDESMIGTVAWDKTMRIWDSANGQQKYKFDTTGQNWTGGFSPDSKKFAGTCGDGSFYIYSLSDGAMLVHHRADSRSSWMRALSWLPDSKIVAVGEGHGSVAGRFFLYDVERKEVTQERILSTEACPVTPEIRRFMGSYLECKTIRSVDGGRKVVVLTSGDGGIETYDLESWEKWRFAKPGVDPEFREGIKGGGKMTEEEMDKGQQKKIEENVLVHGAYSMTVWEDQARAKVWLASMDGDAVRIWHVPMTKVNGS
jgi:WD40 repeat protein